MDYKKYLEYIISIIDNQLNFLIGFNERNIPKVYKDEDYLNDFEKEYLNLDGNNYWETFRRKINGY